MKEVVMLEMTPEEWKVCESLVALGTMYLKVNRERDDQFDNLPSLINCIDRTDRETQASFLTKVVILTTNQLMTDAQKTL